MCIIVILCRENKLKISNAKETDTHFTVSEVLLIFNVFRAILPQ